RIARDGDAAEVRAPGEAMGAERALGWLRPRHGCEVPFGVVRAADGFGDERQVLDRSRERAEHVHVPHRARLARRLGDMAGVRNAPLGRLQPEQAAEMRGRAYRTGEITPHVKGAQACGDRGRTAAGRSARRALEVPGIIRAAED